MSRHWACDRVEETMLQDSEVTVMGDEDKKRHERRWDDRLDNAEDAQKGSAGA
jgi:hypothetical protein